MVKFPEAMKEPRYILSPVGPPFIEIEEPISWRFFLLCFLFLFVFLRIGLVFYWDLVFVQKKDIIQFIVGPEFVLLLHSVVLIGKALVDVEGLHLFHDLLALLALLFCLGVLGCVRDVDVQLF